MSRSRVLLMSLACAVSIGFAEAPALLAQSAATTAKAPPPLPARLQPATRQIIERLADSLTGLGVPATPLYDKAAEGVLKNADDARILTAVRSLARELSTASSLLGASASPNDVVSAAGALRAGVSTRAIQQLASRKGKADDKGNRLAMSYIIVAALASRGVPVEAAVTAVDDLLLRGAVDTQLIEFQRGVERDLLAGRDVNAALSTRAEGVLRRR
ncbi:MAG: hypothetical protein ACO1Q7_05645 [Gemmatimonas sp.]